MLEGLQYLHGNEIIHRDLKCANVLVDNMGVIKLSDFGASQRIEQACGFNTDDFTQSESFKGTPYWTAPEVLRQIEHNYPADIWSIGCCVIEMLTSKPPW